jgi:hypothetical protein
MLNVLEGDFFYHLLWFLKDAQEYADRNSMFFVETSAKTADNINQLFEVCIRFRIT